MVQLIFKKIYSILRTQILDEPIIGFGSGEIINFIIEQMVKEQINFNAVSSATMSTRHLQKLKVPMVDFSELLQIPVYINTIDACNNLNQAINSSNGNFTQEKLLAYNSKKLIGIKSHQTHSKDFNHYPIAVEVLPAAKSFAAREIIKLKGKPVYRNNFTTENFNTILDIYDLPTNSPIALEDLLNNIPGVVDCSLFTKKTFDIIV